MKAVDRKKELRGLRTAFVAELRRLGNDGNGRLGNLTKSMLSGRVDVGEQVVHDHNTISLAQDRINAKESRNKQLKRAIEAIDTGTYGKCEECEEDIPIKRLEVVPATELCVKCKEKQEARIGRRFPRERPLDLDEVIKEEKEE